MKPHGKQIWTIWIFLSCRYFTAGEGEGKHNLENWLNFWCKFAKEKQNKQPRSGIQRRFCPLLASHLWNPFVSLEFQSLVYLGPRSFTTANNPCKRICWTVWDCTRICPRAATQGSSNCNPLLTPAIYLHFRHWIVLKSLWNSELSLMAAEQKLPIHCDSSHNYFPQNLRIKFDPKPSKPPF